MVFLPSLDMQADPGPQSPLEKITFKKLGQFLRVELETIIELNPAIGPKAMRALR